ALSFPGCSPLEPCPSICAGATITVEYLRVGVGTLGTGKGNTYLYELARTKSNRKPQIKTETKTNTISQWTALPNGKALFRPLLHTLDNTLSSLFFGVQIGMSYGDIGTGHIDIPTSFASVNKDRPHPISKTRIRGDTSSKKRPSAQRIEEDQSEPKRVGQTHDSSAKLAKTAKTAKTTLKGGPKPPKVRESKKIPFFFVQTFHATSHSLIVRHGYKVWEEAYTFAIVRHPLARQVSNFFFLIGHCDGRKDCLSDRMIPEDAIDMETDEEKIEAFHSWMANLYKAHPPGTPTNYLMGSKGHGNEDYDTFNATQTSWMVDPNDNNKIAVQKVYKLEELSTNMDEIASAIPCLKPAGGMAKENASKKTYPHYTKFSKNEKTNRIMREVFGIDYENFGYEYDPKR
ncbi:hypothetical protein THAOC_03713, partial [Thalassiosira oceanica]